MATKDLDETKILTTKGEFDPLVIYELTLTHHGINKTSGLSLCTNLTHLDLSNNQIIHMDSFRALKALEYLNLANNKIFRIECMEHLPKLEILHMEGNPIFKLKDIENIKHLSSLSSIYFRKGSHKSQIVCLPEYEGHLKTLLPQLKLIDGVHVNYSSVEIPSEAFEYTNLKKCLDLPLPNIGSESRRMKEAWKDALDDAKDKEEAEITERRLQRAEELSSHLNDLIARFQQQLSEIVDTASAPLGSQEGVTRPLASLYQRSFTVSTQEESLCNSVLQTQS